MYLLYPPLVGPAERHMIVEIVTKRNFAITTGSGQRSKILLRPLRWCCVDCVIHHERDVREEKNICSANNQ